ncbi:MAG: polyphosphate kinase [Planctomycetota bacterium]|nr:MAG: polyphosphate kinase [Planctomycetota bacterium]
MDRSAETPPAPAATPPTDSMNPDLPNSPAPPSDADDPRLYFNRELSLLAFNRRVLAQARDPSTPLLERLRFLTISSLNLDEFFEIRVAGLHEQAELGVATAGPDGLEPRHALTAISESSHQLVGDQYRVLGEELLPELAKEGIHLVFRDSWSEPIRKWIKRYFKREVLPVLTPVGLDPAHPFPMVLNKSLNMIVSLSGRDAFGRSSRMAVVQAPRLLPRLIPLPEEVAGGPTSYVTLSSVIHANVGALFPGMKVEGCYAFRVTRNSDLWVDEEEVDDLMRALQGELRRRNFGQAVRLEVNAACPEDTCRFLLRQFGLTERELYRVRGPVNLHRLAVLIDLVGRPDLKFPPFVPAQPEGAPAGSEIFAALRERDVLLHHPFESFSPVVELLQAAATDPKVLAIKMTLYRTGASSPMTDALLEAARNGKEVTAVIELRARFDEEANIDIANRLQEAGVRVVYGIVGFKAHCKMLLVVRRESGKLRRYVHLGTGNYHSRTARMYTDFGLLTADREIAEDVHNVFHQLTGLGKVGNLQRLVQSPFAMHHQVLEYIADATKAATKGRPASIQAKMNSLLDKQVIAALYEASQAGVQIDLVIRGLCALRPGLPGVSENIRVRSIVGRFLEHTRIARFTIDGEDITLCSSADWMPRNFFHRVEVAFPIMDPKLCKRVIEEGLDVYLRDNMNAWELGPDGEYTPCTPGADTPLSAQQSLLEGLASRSH